MIDRDQFRKHVQDALAHLYDALYLREHPLAQLAAAPEDQAQAGAVLRRLLLESIQELKPPPNSPPDTWAACRYQLLYLRYVRDKSMGDWLPARSQRAPALPPSARRDRRPDYHALAAVDDNRQRNGFGELVALATPIAGQDDAEDYQSEVDRLATVLGGARRPGGRAAGSGGDG